MRLQAAASRDDFLGDWAVAAEYRTAARSTGAGWSASLLVDGRLAVLVTEAQAHGVPAALATAALTGAFAAATTTNRTLQLDDLLASLRASAATVVRGGEPVAAFVAIFDAAGHSITWACAGHPGASVIPPASEDASRPTAILLGAPETTTDRLGASLDIALRDTTPLPSGSMVVIASTELRGTDDAHWLATLRDHAATGPQLAKALVDGKLGAGPPQEDLLAVVVRRRPDRRSMATI
ncbi:MAG: SpoIIE family protein phosphatase [Kofleriaceae bacterium]